MNRKLIRTTLAEIKGKGRDVSHQKERVNGAPSRASGSGDSGGAPMSRSSAPSPSSIQVRKRTPPPMETNAEIFYYKKQIDAHTLMIIVLMDGEGAEERDTGAPPLSLLEERDGAPLTRSFG